MIQAAQSINDEQFAGEQFLLQLRRQFPQAPHNGGAVSSLPEIMAVLRTLRGSGASSHSLVSRLLEASQNIGTPLQLDPDQYALLAWVDESWCRLHIDYPLHPSLAIKIQNLLPVVAAVALADEDFLIPGQHPMQQLLDLVYGRCMGWHRGLGRAGGMLYNKLGEIEKQLHEWFDQPDLDIAAITASLHAFLEKERKRADKMRDRVLATEQGKLKAISARMTTARLLNELMADKQFSAPMVELLQGRWHESLQLTLLKWEAESDSWQYAERMTRTLIWSLQPFDSEDEEHRQKLYKVIPGIAGQLRKVLINLQTEPHALEQVLSDVETAHVRLLRNMDDQAVEVEPLDTGAFDSETQLSEQMLEVIETLTVGDCFGVKLDAGGMQRVHLALKVDEYHQLLFVNRMGMMAMQKSFEEFACLLTAGIAMPMAQGPAFSNCLLEAVDLPIPQTTAETPAAAVELDPVVKQELEQRLQEDKETRAEENETDFTPDLPAVSEIEAEAEIEPSQSGEAEPELDLELDLDMDLDLEMDFSIETETNCESPESAAPEEEGEGAPEPAEEESSQLEAPPELRIGDWLSFTDGPEHQVCKLVVRIDSQDRYLFVNDKGIRQRELLGTELAALFSDGRCEQLGRQSSFEASVDKMLDRLREGAEGEES